MTDRPIIRYLGNPPYAAISTCWKCRWESTARPGHLTARVALECHEKDEHEKVTQQPEPKLNGKTGRILAIKAEAARKKKADTQQEMF